MPETITVPDFHVYKENVTEYWDKDIVRRAGTLYNVYLFDANKHVNCCELTPSYEMHYLGPTWTESPEDDEVNQKLFEDVLKGVIDEDEVVYRHVRSVDLSKCEQRTFSPEQWGRYLRDEDGNAEDAWKEALEDVMEYCQGNGYIY